MWVLNTVELQPKAMQLAIEKQFSTVSLLMQQLHSHLIVLAGIIKG